MKKTDNTRVGFARSRVSNVIITESGNFRVNPVRMAKSKEFKELLEKFDKAEALQSKRK